MSAGSPVLRTILTSFDVLLVRKHQQQRVFHFSVQYYPMQLLPGLVDTRTIKRVDDEDETLCACMTGQKPSHHPVLSHTREVMPP